MENRTIAGAKRSTKPDQANKRESSDSPAIKPELLAPAGNIESFHAAVENGADAVYLGLKKFNARATASNFSLEELSTLMPFARGRGIRIYVTVNSQIAGPELPEILDTLHALSALKPDALIVQDAGLFYLARNYFPGLKLHASTLAAAHNSAGVAALERMGARRVVLARELSLAEIRRICGLTGAELEIFIHGALCYSWSGLCLASSYRGGRSGMRGECVQPCRLRFRQGRKEGFFLSCNDLCALPLIPELMKLRLAGFKIEGRMKPASYIGLVVKAYRMVMDARPGDEKKAIAAAGELLSRAPSRYLTSGHLREDAAAEVLTPHRSGSSGIWIGTVKSVREGRAVVELRRDLEKGDRLRPESAGKEEGAFTASEIFDRDGTRLPGAGSGSRVTLVCPAWISPGDRLFKVGTKSEYPAGIWKKIRSEAPEPVRFKAWFPGRDRALNELRRGAAPERSSTSSATAAASAEARGSGAESRRSPEILIVKVGAPDDLVKVLQSPAAFVLLAGGRSNLERIAKQRFSPVQMKKIGLSLPALLSEEKDLPYYRAAVSWFVKKGFRTWELNNWGHFDFFQGIEGLRLIAGSRLNLRNEAALAQAKDLGCAMSVLSLEITSEELRALGEGRFGPKTIVTVYSWPPLFTSRLVPEPSEDKPFFTAREDVYYLARRAGNAFIYADRPVSLLDELPLLRSRGFRHFLIDASDGPGKRVKALDEVLGGFFSAGLKFPFSRFNFDRRV